MNQDELAQLSHKTIRVQLENIAMALGRPGRPPCQLTYRRTQLLDELARRQEQNDGRP